MKILFKLLKNIILKLIILTIFIYNIFDLNFMTTHNFDMITLNTVLVGFLFTIYTLLVSLMNEEVVKTYSEMNELPKVYENIVKGIVLGISTCLLSILILCIYGEPKSKITVFNKILYSIDIALFLIVLLSIAKAILDMTSIVGAVRDRKISNIKENEANKDMENRFNKKY